MGDLYQYYVVPNVTFQNAATVAQQTINKLDFINTPNLQAVYNTGMLGQCTFFY